MFMRVYPFLFPGVTCLLFVGVMLDLFKGRDGSPPPWFVKWIVLGVGSTVSCLAIAFANSIQEVYLGQDKLRASGWKGVEEISLDAIESIDQTYISNPKLIVIRLRTQTKFGDRIRFIPIKWYSIFGSHPLVGELEEAIRRQPPALPTKKG